MLRIIHAARLLKKGLLLYLVLFGCFLQAGAQTSEEEFLYANLGYQEQLLKGLDDKKGYRWKVITEYLYQDKPKHPKRSFQFEGLYREGERRPCAIVVIYREDRQEEKRDGTFFCIPSSESEAEILAKAQTYFVKEVKFNDSVKLAYIQALSKLAMYLARE